eukprot:TRINITY_DN6281_c2_g2_i1.p1 TRINITY_DN6281_c2_g2~~TRINITY_DN6281_c2_g2_i1.p1  ORF type:complete len:103 (+),score=6.47 TRINITY_DN6281_c2_g2_i1:712-1020(+)
MNSHHTDEQEPLDKWIAIHQLTAIHTSLDSIRSEPEHSSPLPDTQTAETNKLHPDEHAVVFGWGWINPNLLEKNRSRPLYLFLCEYSPWRKALIPSWPPRLD